VRRSHVVVFAFVEDKSLAVRRWNKRRGCWRSVDVIIIIC